jgi:iron complex outermembrane receptor protein
VQSRFFRRTADNDFSFRPAAGLPQRQQQHAAANGSGWLQSAHWKISPRQQLALFLWTQQQFREIPPTLVQTRSEATQADSILRTALHWQRSADRWLLQLRTAFFRERIQYNDPAIRLFSPSNFASWLMDAEASFPQGKNGQLQGGLTNMYTQATTTAYPEGAAVAMRQLAVFGSWRRQWGAQLSSQLSLRQEWIDGRPQKLLPTLSLRSQLRHGLWLRAQMARSFRFPTLNDRYWQPGGQPDLLPEYAWSQELGVSWAADENWQLSVTGYHRFVHNWILWYPAPGQLFWSAANATAVRASGLELRLQHSLQLRQWQFRTMAGYDYTRAINQTALQRPLMKAGQQLAYTPVHQAFVSILAEYKRWKMSYQQRYTGAVSTLTEPLPAYLPAFAQLDYRIDKYGLTTFIQINNVWNADYQAVERRPMPGRHWLFGCRLRLDR